MKLINGHKKKITSGLSSILLFSIQFEICLIRDANFLMYKSHFAFEFPFYRNEAEVKQQNLKKKINKIEQINRKVEN